MEPESGQGTARGFFLIRPEIHPTRGSNPRPQGATREPQPSGLRTFRTKQHQQRWLMRQRGNKLKVNPGDGSTI
jgi:hypothetical protein